MKILLTVLLLAATAGGIYYFTRNTTNAQNDKIQKGLIIGTWKMDSLNVNNSFDQAFNLSTVLHDGSDSGLFRLEFEFKKGGLILSSQNGSVKDTGHYEWNKMNELILKEDSTTEILSILKLNKDSLIVRDKDSSVIYFIKMK